MISSLVAACAAGQPRTLGPAPTANPDADVTDAATAPLVSEEDAGGPGAAKAPDWVDAGGSAMVDDAAPAEGSEIAISDEPPYSPGARRRPKNALAASSEDDLIARWNRGGPTATPSTDAKPPHPAPRVKVDVAQIRGHIEEADVLRVARNKGYWPFRLCYEEGLRRAPKLHGTIRFRVTVGPGGSPRGVRKIAAEIDDTSVVSCVLKVARGLALAAPQRGTPEVTLEVSFWPGDAPIHAGEGSSSAPGIPSSLVTALRARWPDVRACYAIGLRSVPELWGRLVLRLHVASSGRISEAAEVESHFPNADVTECILRAYERSGLSPGEDRIILYPLRLGAPPAPVR